jgi:ubiquinone/menaquinone biosynthesis C-methylase UbiE
MLEVLRRSLGRSPLFAFNLVGRDRWVAEQVARLPSGSKVLDVGAGSCPYRSLFAHCDYHAQDFAALQSDQLRDGAYGRIDYVCDATAIPAADGCFDAILCTEMLEHVPDPVAVIRECSRLLRPNGRLMLTAPLGSGIHQEPHHYYGGFTPYWYQRFLAQVGFQDIQVEANAGSFKFFSQESLRFLATTRPFARLPFLPSLLWLPLWLGLLPILGGVIPLACYGLDRYDREMRFTVGYHVTATRAGPDAVS